MANTYYAKVVGVFPSGMEKALYQLTNASFHAGLLPYVLAFAVAWSAPLSAAVTGRWREIRPPGFESFLAAAWIGYWFCIGGDWLGDRFLLILVPLGICAWLYLIAPALNRRTWVCAVVVILILQLAPLTSDPRFRYQYPKYDIWVTLGSYLHDKYPEEVLATDAAGKIPYFS